MPTRYYINLPDPAQARGNDPDLAFRAHGAEGFADELQDAMRGDALFQRWRARQEDPDAVDETLAAIDPSASVIGKQDDLQMSLVVTTTLPSAVLRHRLGLLAGRHWQLRDVVSA